MRMLFIDLLAFVAVMRSQRTHRIDTGAFDQLVHFFTGRRLQEKILEEVRQSGSMQVALIGLAVNLGLGLVLVVGVPFEHFPANASSADGAALKLLSPLPLRLPLRLCLRLCLRPCPEPSPSPQPSALSPRPSALSLSLTR